VAELRRAIAAALSSVDPVMVALAADWVRFDVPEPVPPLGADQITAIWRAVQRRAQ
jgi:hypothetical protein